MNKVFVTSLSLFAQLISFQAFAAISCSFDGETVRIEHTTQHLAAGYVRESGPEMGKVHASVNPRTGIYRYGFKISGCQEQACAMAYDEHSFAGFMYGYGFPICSGYQTITEIFYNPKAPESSEAVITSVTFNRSLGLIKTDKATKKTYYPAKCSWVN